MEHLTQISEDLLKLPKSGKHNVTRHEFKTEIKALTSDFQQQFDKIESFMKCLVDGITTILTKVNVIEQDLQLLKECATNRQNYSPIK